MQIEESFEDIITLDNNPVDFSSYIKVQVIKGKSPVLYKNFKNKWYQNNLKEPFRAAIRGKCTQFPMFVLTTDRTIVDSLQNIVLSEMQKLVTGLELPIKVLKVTIGKVTPPKAVITETIKTAAQKQRIITQESMANAEEARKRTEEMKALADRAYIKKMGFTNDQYIKIREIQMIEGKKGAQIIYGNATPTYPVR